MKVVILAGGLGTRISEETHLRPKPMIEIYGKPILWHVMSIYSKHGLNDFIICCGYKGYVIKEFFLNYLAHVGDVHVDLAKNVTKVLAHNAEPWKITMIDTGDSTMTGGRLRRVAGHLDPDEDFCFTYGDGVADIDISAELAFHKAHGRLATVAAVLPPGRYGALEMEGEGKVAGFIEKPRGDNALINGGFFVLNPKCIDYIAGDETSWELEPLSQIAADDQLRGFRHEGFWQAMDTLRDKVYLERLCEGGNPPWL